jgi:hypothetical protein
MIEREPSPPRDVAGDEPLSHSARAACADALVRLLRGERGLPETLATIRGAR